MMLFDGMIYYGLSDVDGYGPCIHIVRRTAQFLSPLRTDRGRKKNEPPDLRSLRAQRSALAEVFALLGIDGSK